jgi:hypothetical protein
MAPVTVVSAAAARKPRRGNPGESAEFGVDPVWVVSCVVIPVTFDPRERAAVYAFLRIFPFGVAA